MDNIHFMPLSRGIRLLATGLALLTLICEHHAANVTNLQVASAPALECRSGSGGSFAPTLSADSRYVFFLSESRNLVTNDLESPFLNLYRRDLIAGKSELVSVNDSGVGGANASVTRYSASSNGQVVAFATGASNLVNHPVYRYGGTYVRNLAQATTTWGIINTNGQPSLSSSGEPVLSADGRLLFFIGVGFDLVSTPSSFPNRDLFSRDLVGNQNTVVSIGSKIVYNCNWCGPQQYSITPDGRFVAFINEAHNLMLNVTNYGDVYVRDMQSTALTWASTNVPAYLTGNYSCLNVALSADGQCVAFWGRVYGSASILFHHSLGTGATTPILTNLGSYYSPVEISSDGRFVAHDDGTNVFLYDAQLQTNLLVSINREGTGPANDVSHSPAITPDGRFIVFLSSATDLVTNATNGKFQVYVRDMVTGTTRLVTVNTNGAASDADLESTQPVISNDGRLVAFESPAADLVADDLNRASDVFVRDLSTATTQLVSERESTRPSSTGVGFSTKSTSPGCISSNGQWVAFASSDGNLVANDTNGVNDVFVGTGFKPPKKSAVKRGIALPRRRRHQSG